MELTPEQHARVAADLARRLEGCAPWTRKTRWRPELDVQASSYPALNLFPGVRPSTALPRELGDGEFVDSPQGRFRYVLRRHRRGVPISTWWNGKIGSVVFDGDIELPMLFEREAADAPPSSTSPWRRHPWMSLTPAELLTLRPGTKLARGRVVIAGLGLAHQLLEVAKRRAVTELIVVERSSELCELVMPQAMQVLGSLGHERVRVIIGDAFEVLPKLEADVALVDVFPAYGDNSAAMAKLRKRCRKIGKLWDWGWHR